MGTLLLNQEQIRKRIEELGQEITRDYQGKNLVVVGVLKGSFIFMADLVRQIDLPLSCDFLRVSSYQNNQSTGLIRLEFDLTQPIQDADVLLVEDIIDTGKTLAFLTQHLNAKKPRSLKLCSFLYKPVRPELRSSIDYLGFEAPLDYLVGYGLDDQGLGRNKPYVEKM